MLHILGGVTWKRKPGLLRSKCQAKAQQEAQRNGSIDYLFEQMQGQDEAAEVSSLL